MTERMLIALSKLPMRLFAIDEAHCISSWGPAFRTKYQDLQNLKDRFPNVPVAALTATPDASRKGNKVPPYVVFPDKTLADMAQRKCCHPSRLDALAKQKG